MVGVACPDMCRLDAIGLVVAGSQRPRCLRDGDGDDRLAVNLEHLNATPDRWLHLGEHVLDLGLGSSRIPNAADREARDLINAEEDHAAATVRERGHGRVKVLGNAARCTLGFDRFQVSLCAAHLPEQDTHVGDGRDRGQFALPPCGRGGGGPEAGAGASWTCPGRQADGPSPLTPTLRRVGTRMLNGHISGLFGRSFFLAVEGGEPPDDPRDDAGLETCCETEPVDVPEPTEQGETNRDDDDRDRNGLR